MQIQCPYVCLEKTLKQAIIYINNNIIIKIRYQSRLLLSTLSFTSLKLQSSLLTLNCRTAGSPRIYLIEDARF